MFADCTIKCRNVKRVLASLLDLISVDFRSHRLFPVSHTGVMSVCLSLSLSLCLSDGNFSRYLLQTDVQYTLMTSNTCMLCLVSLDFQIASHRLLRKRRGGSSCRTNANRDCLITELSLGSVQREPLLTERRRRSILATNLHPGIRLVPAVEFNARSLSTKPNRPTFMVETKRFIVKNKREQRPYRPSFTP